MGEFRMPALGADMTEGTLVEWLVAPGDAVHRGQIIAVVDTVKSAIDIEAFEDGVVDRLLVEPGLTLAVGTPMAVIGTAAQEPATAEAPAAPEAAEAAEPAREPVQAPAAEAPPPARAAAHAEPGISPIVRHLAHDLHVDLATVTGTGPGGGITRHDVEVAAAAASAGSAAAPAAPPAPAAQRRPQGRPHTAASPRARARAAELGVDLAAVSGTGPGGAVTVADVEAARGQKQAQPAAEAPAAPTEAPAPSAPPEPAARRGAATRRADVRAGDRHAAMQAATGALMARSKREIPHYYLEASIDMAAAMAWLARHNEGRPVAERVLPAAVLLTATARCLATMPDLNGFYTEAGYEPHAEVDLGVAVSQRAGGLIVANLRGAQTKSVDELMAALKDIAVRARAGRLTSSEMSVPTVTVTNLGDQGADLVHGVIYPPQVALVGFGRIVERPWAIDGMLAVRPVVVATLAGDHRVTDGHRGSRFLTALDAALQRPEEL